MAILQQLFPGDVRRLFLGIAKLTLKPFNLALPFGSGG
jgi:hypothetical protein